MSKDLEPMEAIDQEDYEDPNLEEVTDPNHPGLYRPDPGNHATGR